MADPTTALTPELEALLATRREGYAMPRLFYQSEALYEAELRRLWCGGWLFAGFACEIPNSGDYLTFEIDRSSLIVMRDDDGEVGAFHNVCRHRGTQLCRTESGAQITAGSTRGAAIFSSVTGCRKTSTRRGTG